jgi:hypothetical protein
MNSALNWPDRHGDAGSVVAGEEGNEPWSMRVRIESQERIDRGVTADRFGALGRLSLPQELRNFQHLGRSHSGTHGTESGGIGSLVHSPHFDFFSQEPVAAAHGLCRSHAAQRSIRASRILPLPRTNRPSIAGTAAKKRDRLFLRPNSRRMKRDFSETHNSESRYDGSGKPSVTRTSNMAGALRIVRRMEQCNRYINHRYQE